MGRGHIFVATTASPCIPRCQCPAAGSLFLRLLKRIAIFHARLFAQRRLRTQPQPLGWSVRSNSANSPADGRFAFRRASVLDPPQRQARPRCPRPTSRCVRADGLVYRHPSGSRRATTRQLARLPPPCLCRPLCRRSLRGSSSSTPNRRPACGRPASMEMRRHDLGGPAPQPAQLAGQPPPLAAALRAAVRRRPRPRRLPGAPAVGLQAAPLRRCRRRSLRRRLAPGRSLQLPPPPPPPPAASSVTHRCGG